MAGILYELQDTEDGSLAYPDATGSKRGYPAGRGLLVHGALEIFDQSSVGEKLSRLVDWPSQIVVTRNLVVGQVESTERRESVLS